MQLLIKVGCSSVQEWSFIELQGVLETKENLPYDGLHIGDLHYSSNGSANLIVGHHLLTGKMVTLEQPIAVLRKVYIENNAPSYNVIAMITKKLVFKNRPKPLVSAAVK